MKKKIFIRILMLAVVIIVLLGIYVSANKLQSSTSNMSILNEDELNSIIKLSKDYSALSKDKDQINDKIYKYAYWLGQFKPSKEQREEIIQLLQQGADADILIEICNFWEDTDAPFSIVREIWEQRPLENIDAFDKPIFWIEEIYNHLTNKTEEALSVKEVQNYLDSGLTIDDMMAANRMSRKSGVNIHDILKKVQNGETWQEILLPEATRELKKVSAQYSACDLLDAIIVAKKTSSSPLEVLKENSEIILDEETDIISIYEEKCQELVEKDLQTSKIVTDAEGGVTE